MADSGKLLPINAHFAEHLLIFYIVSAGTELVNNYRYYKHDNFVENVQTCFAQTGTKRERTMLLQEAIQLRILELAGERKWSINKLAERSGIAPSALKRTVKSYPPLWIQGAFRLLYERGKETERRDREGSVRRERATDTTDAV